MSDIPFDISPGSVLAGKYRIEKVLGEGGMGVVIGARHLHLDEPVAIKVLRTGLCGDSLVVDRFLREARAAAKIKSPHVVRVTDADRLPSGAPYLVMEWLEGSDLASIVHREGRLDQARAARYVIEACEALSKAHALGIVHRDLKPANLFVARLPDGSTCTKILDFGISKLLGEEVTRSDVSLGTPSYMAPEQVVSTRDVDARADIWSLGVVLYKLVTGTVPFKASTPSELGMKVLFGEPVPPGEERPSLAPALTHVILRCLRREPEQRFATAAELAAALAPIAAGALGPIAPTPVTPAGPRAGDTTPPFTSTAAVEATGNGSDGGSGIHDATPKPTSISHGSAGKPRRVGQFVVAALALTLGGGFARWMLGTSAPPEVESGDAQGHEVDPSARARSAVLEPPHFAPVPASVADGPPVPKAGAGPIVSAAIPTVSAAIPAASATVPNAAVRRVVPAPSASSSRTTPVEPSNAAEDPFGGKRK